MIRTFLFAFLIIFSMPALGTGAPNRLPQEVTEALRTADKTILFSLEPEEDPEKGEEQIYRYKVLGKTGLSAGKTAAAAKEFELAVSQWNGAIAMCFNPRHALQISSGGHVYDLLLCYECQGLYIYKDGELLKSMGVTGSPKVLNGMLVAAKVPLAHMESEEDIAARWKKQKESEARWLAGMPKSIRPLWKESFGEYYSSDIDPLRKALTREYPETQTRILALFKWYGSGDGPWSGFPVYEEIPEKMLLDSSTPELIAAAETNLDPVQTEGAARLFAVWDFSKKRPNDFKMLPRDLKRKLLKHSLQSPIQDNRERAQDAFEKKVI